jgi:hypothetical protein
LGAALVIASNIGMLVVGVAYLVTLPFKESLKLGLANVFVPFFAVYYWYSRWPRMKRPVINTVSSFLPIALVGLAYLVYEEGPEVEKELPVLEQKLEQEFAPLEKKFEEAVDGAKGSARRELPSDVQTGEPKEGKNEP